MGERVLKMLLSLLAVALFAAVAAAMVRSGPLPGEGKIHMFPGPPARIEDGEAADALDVPVPPDTGLTFSTRVGSGTHSRYESRLSVEGLWLFYTEQMPLRGWSRDLAFESEMGGTWALSFKKNGVRCIIGFEEDDAFTTALTVLVMSTPR